MTFLTDLLDKRKQENDIFLFIYDYLQIENVISSGLKKADNVF